MDIRKARSQAIRTLRSEFHLCGRLERQLNKNAKRAFPAARSLVLKAAKLAGQRRARASAAIATIKRSDKSAQIAKALRSV